MSDRAPIWQHDGFVDRDETNVGTRLGVEALNATKEQNLAALHFFADREGDTAKPRENPLLHRPETQRIRAVLLTSYKYTINELTQLTQPLTSHHITSLSSGP